MTMAHNRYPKDIVLTVEDFAECGWKEVLAGTDREDFLEDYPFRQPSAKVVKRTARRWNC